MNAISSEDEVTLISVLTGIIMNTFVLSDRHFLTDLLAVMMSSWSPPFKRAGFLCREALLTFGTEYFFATGAVLHMLWYLVASLASANSLPAALPNAADEKCLQILPNISCGYKVIPSGEPKQWSL